jgi:hypothetical protein
MGRKHRTRQSFNNAYLWGGNRGQDKVLIMLIYGEETEDNTKF